METATLPPESPPAEPGAPPAGDAALLSAWLAARDAPCPICSYNLRALRTPRCPECSAPLHLHVGSDNLRLGPWLLAVLAPALALGFDGVVSILLTIGVTLNPPVSPGEFQVVLAILGTFILLAAASLAGILVLVRKRRRWNRLSVRAQWRIAAVLFTAVGAGHALFGWLVVSRTM
ncbi:MAG: hypothetical protein WD749_05945 [Phycisphaerales bacterium]